jgi:predicted Zn-dependent peptidase
MLSDHAATKVRRVRLESGVTALLEPVDNVVSVSAGIWVRSGSRHERPEQYGYAHFLEHMLFKGTERFSGNELARVIDRVGGQHNAATNREYTCYYINIVSEYLELAIDILSEMYYHPLLKEEDIEREKNVIMEEIRMYEDAPDEFVHDTFIEKLLDGHPLSHSILGTMENIASLTRDDLYRFYEEQYLNDNVLVTIAGNFDPDRVLETLNRYFKRSRRGRALRYEEGNETPVQRQQLHTNRDLEQVHFCLGGEGIERNNPLRWALYTLSTVLGGNMSSRLFQNIREKEGISYAIYSFHSSYSDRGLFGIYCATTAERFERAIELIVKECRTILEKGIDSRELEDTRTFLKGNLALSYESNEVRMGQLARNEIAYGRQYSYHEISHLIDKISLDDLRLISEKLFKDITLSLVSTGNLGSFNWDRLDLSL